MRSNDVIHRSVYIISEYYKNNLEPFFDALSGDVLWMGPAQGQLIQGAEALKEAFAQEDHALTFTMGNVSAQCVSPHLHVKEGILHYDVYTHYPSGNTVPHDQRLHFTWRDRRIRAAGGWTYLPEIFMVHISNLWEYDSRDTIYPVHYETVAPPVRTVPATEQYVTVKAADLTVHRIAVSRILYIETVKRSAKLRVHLRSGVLLINGTLPEFERRYPGVLLRTHAGYMVNPAHVRQIRRFALTLSDGTRLPVPEKKFTQIRDALLQGDPPALNAAVSTDYGPPFY